MCEVLLLSDVAVAFLYVSASTSRSPRSIAANGEGRRLYHPSGGDEDEDASRRKKIYPS